jgi:hypothetical protein
MANKSNKPVKGQAKTPKKPGAAPAAAEQKKPGVETGKVDDAPTKEQVAAAVATKPEVLLQRPAGSGALSADGKVRLLDLAHRVFVEETRPHLAFPQETQTSVNRIVAVGILCSIADHIVDGDDTFAQVMSEQGYPALAKAAEDLGFKIPERKALPVNAEGQLVLNSNEVKIPAETKKQIKKEHEMRKEKPELDPEKITSEEDLKKALEYMFVSGEKSLPKLLTSGIEFMKKFRMHEASLAENATEAKAKFEARNSGDWLDDIFSYFRPPVFFTGIGRGMASVTEVEKSPIHAFIIFRDAIRDKETHEPVLNDQESAYCVKCIVKWFCNTNIASNQKSIDELDKKTNAEIIAKCKEAIEKYNKILDYITNPGAEEVEALPDNIGSHFDANGTALTTECQCANRIFNNICKSYYGKQLSDADYKNLVTNIQQRAGVIVNLFRSAGSQLVNYKESNITELEERTEEEKVAIRKAAKKAWEERKSAEEKNA